MVDLLMKPVEKVSKAAKMPEDTAAQTIFIMDAIYNWFRETNTTLRLVKVINRTNPIARNHRERNLGIDFVVYIPPSVRTTHFKYSHDRPTHKGYKNRYAIPYPHRYMTIHVNRGWYDARVFSFRPMAVHYALSKLKGTSKMAEEFCGSFLPNSGGTGFCEGDTYSFFYSDAWSEKTIQDTFEDVLTRYFSSTYNQDYAENAVGSRAMMILLRELEFDTTQNGYSVIKTAVEKARALKPKAVGVVGQCIFPITGLPVVYDTLQKEPGFWDRIVGSEHPPQWKQHNIAISRTTFPISFQYNLPRLRAQMLTIQRELTNNA